MSGSYQAVIDAIRKLQNLDDFVRESGIALQLDVARARVVIELGELIGYGRMMQLAEQLWWAFHPDIALSVGPPVSVLVPCPCGVGYSGPEARSTLPHCDWCGGAGRLTKRALEAIQRDEEPE